jgi:hypothetical protein
MLNSDQIANLAHKQEVDSRLDMAKLGWSILISIMVSRFKQHMHLNPPLPGSA